MHTHLHRTPQPNTFPSFTPKNTPRMVREPHRTHGNKTRISSFSESRTTICTTCHPPIPSNTASPLVFLCPITPTPTKSLHQRASPRSYVSRRYPGPCMSCSHRLLPSTVPRSRVFRVISFALRDRISGYTPRARPRALRGHRLPAVGSPHTCFPGRTYGCP